jgi:hypothetical protein
MDAVVSALNAPMELWWNRSPARNWLQLRLHGSRSNRSAIGAEVTCKTQSRTQTRCVTSTVGYASSKDLTVHFGLDADSKATLRIRWPAGTMQQLDDVAANQRLNVEEPGSQAVQRY